MFGIIISYKPIIIISQDGGAVDTQLANIYEPQPWRFTYLSHGWLGELCQEGNLLNNYCIIITMSTINK